jgi:hypothetical protein
VRFPRPSELPWPLGAFVIVFALAFTAVAVSFVELRRV